MSDLDQLLKKAAAQVAAMSPAEREAMLEAQRRGYVRAEMSWPEPRFRMVKGNKVYDSYEDYLNG